jgi:peroxiredoxin
MSIVIGQKAPPFKLFDTDKKAHSLEDYKGQNIALLFFPFAFTGTCTKEMCQMRDEHSMYKDLDAVILGVSVDSLFTLHRWKAELNIPFALLSDFNKEASAAYDSMYDEWSYGYKGVSKRASFVIDKEGIIRYFEILENASDYPDIDAIKSALMSYEFLNGSTHNS